MYIKPKEIRLQIDGSNPSDIPQLDRLIREITGCDTDDANVVAVELALLEAINNAIFHGCLENKTIAVALTTAGESLQICLEYQGIQMDQSKLAKAPRVPHFDRDDISSLPEHGMGLSIIMNVMDQVDYNFHQDKNQWVFHKNPY